MLTLTSCSSLKTDLKDAKDIQPQKYASKTKEQNSLVHIVRDGGFVGRAMDVKVSVNGNFVAELPAGYKVSIYLSEGTHIIEVVASSIFGGVEAKERVLIKNIESEFRIKFPGRFNVKLIKVEK